MLFQELLDARLLAPESDALEAALAASRNEEAAFSPALRIGRDPGSSRRGESEREQARSDFLGRCGGRVDPDVLRGAGGKKLDGGSEGKR